jgi:type II secretory pathway predicted ATPase ExeA
MYQQYFGLRESPFSITPDPRFFYANSVYLEAYANLRYGIEAKKGFIAVTGEVGTGKTTLLRKLMLSLEKTIHTVLIFNTDVTFNELLRVILRDLGLSTEGKDRLSMVEQLNDYLIEQLEQSQVVCLLIDEVQSLSDESLEGLRLLSNLETDQHKLLQIVLMGQPEFQAKLEQPHLRQLKQRIAIRCEITRLNDDEIGSYINFRLRAAGCVTNDLFDPHAIDKIALYSKGIPRLINVICDNALLIAYASSQKNVSFKVIEEVARDLRLTSGNHLADNKINVPVVESDARNDAVLDEVSVRNDHGKPRSWQTSAIATCFVIGLFIGLASLTERGFFIHSTSKLFNSFQANSTESALPAKDETTGRQTITPRVASAAIQSSPTDSSSTDHPVTIQTGSTIFQIATDAYGSHAVLGMDLIKEFNPEIQNLNLINAGQELLLPVLKQETLLRQQVDGSFRLAIASFLSRREADGFAQRVMQDGFGVIITARRVSSNLVLHRVEIDGLKELQAVNQTIQVGFKSRWLPFTPKPSNENQEGQANRRY